MSLGNALHGYALFRLAQSLFLPAGFCVFVVLIVGSFFYSEFQLQNRYEKEFGTEWVSHYEAKEGPLEDKYWKMGVGVVGTVIVIGLTFGIYAMMMPQGSIKSGGRSRRSRRY